MTKLVQGTTTGHTKGKIKVNGYVWAYCSLRVKKAFSEAVKNDSSLQLNKAFYYAELQKFNKRGQHYAHLCKSDCLHGGHVYPLDTKVNKGHDFCGAFYLDGDELKSLCACSGPICLVPGPEFDFKRWNMRKKEIKKVSDAKFNATATSSLFQSLFEL